MEERKRAKSPFAMETRHKPQELSGVLAEIKPPVTGQRRMLVHRLQRCHKRNTRRIYGY